MAINELTDQSYFDPMDVFDQTSEPLQPLYPDTGTESISVGYPVTEGGLTPGDTLGDSTVAAPTTTTTDSGIPSVDMSFYEGWNDQAAIDADWAATWQDKLNPAQPSTFMNDNPNSDFPNFDVGEDQFMSDINSQYDERIDYLSKAEQAIRAGQPEILEALAADMRAGTSRAGTARGAELGTLQGAGQQATGRKEDALASARRLYSELRRGSQQRFGGASSAGEAMNTLLGVEQQKQMGQTRRDFGQTMATIEREKTNIESQYQDQLLQLEANNKRDKAQATNEFNARLDEINHNRLLASDAKYQARLGVLQDLRDKNFQIQAQQTQFKQQLEVNRQQQIMDLDTYSKQLKMSSGAGQGASNAFSNQTTVNPRSDITAGGGPSSQPVDFNAKVLQGFTRDDELPFWMK